MPIYNTRELLDTLEKTVKETIKQASTLQLLDSNKLSQIPAPGKWNVLQVIYHLNSYNHYYLPQIEQVIKQGRNYPAISSFKPGILGNYFTNMMLPGNEGNVKNTMKAPKDHTPANGFNDVAALKEFIAGQGHLLRLIDEARKVNIGKLTVPISISRFIKIKLGDTFRFLIAHQQRHFVQISNTLKAIGVTEGIDA